MPLLLLQLDEKHFLASKVYQHYFDLLGGKIFAISFEALLGISKFIRSWGGRLTR